MRKVNFDPQPIALRIKSPKVWRIFQQLVVHRAGAKQGICFAEAHKIGAFAVFSTIGSECYSVATAA